ncbi:10786_t:CDS:2 [Funneliformis mosseae]|uniref:10786_t:CDS:1 n=1 Tax=Funneliformis mosseae TaxID=27381 RepID=A0A9N8Z3Z1_FUNMO|nr:10786_t:CDS:2 [Funneliformis mosseae]
MSKIYKSNSFSKSIGNYEIFELLKYETFDISNLHTPSHLFTT